MLGNGVIGIAGMVTLGLDGISGEVVPGVVRLGKVLPPGILGSVVPGLGTLLKLLLLSCIELMGFKVLLGTLALLGKGVKDVPIISE